MKNVLAEAIIDICHTKTNATKELYLKPVVQKHHQLKHLVEKEQEKTFEI